MYYTVLKHSGHLRTLEKCRKHSPAARVFYISLKFSNARRVLSQCNTRLRLLYLLNIIAIERQYILCTHVSYSEYLKLGDSLVLTYFCFCLFFVFVFFFFVSCQLYCQTICILNKTKWFLGLFIFLVTPSNFVTSTLISVIFCYKPTFNPFVKELNLKAKHKIYLAFRRSFS